MSGFSDGKRTALAAFIALSLSTATGSLWAQQSPQSESDAQAQRARAEREARERAEREAVPAPRKSAAPSPSDWRVTTLPEETPCFTLKQLTLSGDPKHDFAFARTYLNQYAGRCVGQAGISLLVRRVSDLILSRGYVTTRIGLPEQNLSEGTLTLLLVPGKLRAIRFDDAAIPARTWRSAFPIREGDLLNLRALEQGLEQLKRVPSQDATMQIVPADAPGESDVAVSLKRQRPIRGSVSFDDAGSPSTSQPQLNANAYVDSLLGLNDMLTLGASQGMTRRDGFGTNGFTLGYTLPFGNWRASANAYGYRYEQTVVGTSSTYPVSGQSQTGELVVERLIARGQTYRIGMELRAGQRTSHTFVAGNELTTQKRKATYAELALNWRQYTGRAQLDLRISHKRGLPWLGGDADKAGLPSSAPTFEYGINSLDANLGLPFQLGRLRSYWNSQLHWQQSSDNLYANEFMAIGGRYTVNGFSGKQTLASGNGGYWRNTVTFSVTPWFQPYAGIDMGSVKTKRSQYIQGGQLVGGYAGLKGQAPGGIGWDAFVGWPIKHPETFQTEGRTTGFRIYLQF